MVILQSSLALLALAAGSNVVTAKQAPSATSHVVPAPTGTSYPDGFDMKTSWANLSPYADSPGFNVTKGFPAKCELSQVHVLHRHAQRYPGNYSSDGANMTQFAAKLSNYAKKNPNTPVATGPLEFLNDWEYLLGYNDLLPSGAATEANAGASFWSQYGRLLYRAGRGQADWNNSLNVWPNGTAREKPTFRTTSYPRILESARWWLSGFFSNVGAKSSYEDYNLVIIPEEDGFNNTLTPSSSCTGGQEAGFSGLKHYQYALAKSVLKRLTKYFPEDFGLDASDAWGLLNLCPYEYATLGQSSFCSLFTEQEWRNFEYGIDIEYYGSYGFGSPSGRAQGIGYVQELAARLKNRLITSSHSSINYTYDDNLKDFPLHQNFYMDMSHDNTIVAVLTALGLEYFNYGPHGLPINVINAPQERNFYMSKATPFGARLYSEIWTCPSDISFENLQPQMYKNPDLSSDRDTKDYIRLVLNNAPLPFDGFVPCEDSVNGFCRLEEFIDYIPELTKQAEYAKSCAYSSTSTVQVGNGQPPKS
ncbi:hypothetical protein N7478_000045 [Penicillium angulare]|uniref:uncharacterized protein n=1 Tax=Penicillium angulare TaxID=116970 RepID=UPI00254036AF|nr:uncharacterized protein N7478_000045 [Penicillium angulare]KAJ5290794.1 hypothetical protein N7478_000045 [Penicillium angulare]